MRLDIDALAVTRLEALLHQSAMRDDVEIPLLEIGDLVLRFADDDLDDRFVEPVGLGLQFRCLLREAPARLTSSAVSAASARFASLSARTLRRLRSPTRHDPLVHPGAGDLVDADEHRLARFPAGRAVLDEIRRDLVEPLVGGDDLVVLAEQLIEQRRLVRVEFGLLDLLGDAVVQIEPRHAELLAAVLVDELDGRAVLFRALEVVARDIVAEDALGDLVLLE